MDAKIADDLVYVIGETHEELAVQSISPIWGDREYRPALDTAQGSPATFG